MSTHMKTPVRVGLIVFGLIALALSSWNYFDGTPQHSLLQLVKAVENRDRAAFERYIDVERTVESAIDDVINDLIGETIDSAVVSDDPFSAVGVALGTATIEGVKPLAVKAMTEAILEGVESGSIIAALSDQGTAVEDMESINITSSVSMDDARFVGIAGVEKRAGKAVVGLDFRYESLDTTLTARIIMEDRGDYWQVVGVEDLGGFVLSLMSIEEARLAELNKPIRDELARLVELDDLESELVSRGWLEKVLELSVTVKNVSDTDLRNVQVRISGVDGSSESVQFQPIDLLRPDQEKVARTSLNSLSLSSLYEALEREDMSEFTMEVISADVKKGDTWQTISVYPTWGAYRTRALD